MSIHRLFAISAFVLISSGAMAGEQIGVAIDAKTQVIRSAAEGGNQIVQTSTPVFLDDNLKANSTGLAQIKLVDDTKIVVGPDSNVTLDDFVFSSSNSARVVTVSVTKGAFRWISGRSGSKAYTIKTPAGSIGVRGTAFDVTIGDHGTDVLLLNGRINVCPNGSACKTVTHRCEFVSFDEKGIRNSAELLKMDGIEHYKTMFPLIENQQRLNRQFQRETAGCKGFAIQNTINAIFKAIFTPPPAPPPAPPVVAVVEPPAIPGNPGNGGVMGAAGSDPSGRGFGNNVRGVSDLGPGGGNSSGGGGGGGVSSTGSVSASSTPGGPGNGNAGGNGNGNAVGRN